MADVVRGVYAIVHKASGRTYVGASGNVQARWRWHLQKLAAGRHHSPALQTAWTLYGREAFEFRLLQMVPTPRPLRPYEDEWMRTYRDRLFNAMPINRHGAESKAHMSAAAREAWEQRYADGNDRLTLAQRREIARTTRAWAKQPAVRQRMREIALESDAAANFRTPEALAKNRRALLGTPKSPAHRAAMSAKHSSGLCKCHPKRRVNGQS